MDVLCGTFRAQIVPIPPSCILLTTSLLAVIYIFKISINHGVQADVYLETSRTSTTKCFAKIVNDLKWLTIFTRKVSSYKFDLVLNTTEVGNARKS